MPKIKLLIFFVFVIAILYSQRGEVGLSLMSMTMQRENSKGGDTLSYTRSKGISSLHPVLTFNQINFDNIDKYIQLGFFYEPGGANSKSGDNTGVANFAIYQKSHSLKKSIYIKIGIDKRYYFDRLVLGVGVNIPFQSQFYMKGYAEYYYYDNNKTYYELEKVSDIRAPDYTTGINLHQSLFYAVNKNLYLGVDLNTGLMATITNGKRTYVVEVNDIKNNTTTVYQQNITYKFETFTSLSFQPVISLRYCISNKKPKLKT